eukprot:822871-Amorphochlora_amoeboformis.AAC.1
MDLQKQEMLTKVFASIDKNKSITEYLQHQKAFLIPPQPSASLNLLLILSGICNRPLVLYYIEKATMNLMTIRRFRFATEQLAATAIRSVIGCSELDELLSHREKINER